MATFRIIAVGHFCGRDGGPKAVDIPGFEGATAAGFYTTRVVEAPNCRRAAELAANSIHTELARKLGKEHSACILEIESCEKVMTSGDASPRKGFTFFAKD